MTGNRKHDADSVGLSKTDLLELCIIVKDEISFAQTHHSDPLTKDEVRLYARKVFGDAYEEKIVEEMFAELDPCNHGYVTHGDLSGKLVTRADAAAVKF